MNISKILKIIKKNPKISTIIISSIVGTILGPLMHLISGIIQSFSSNPSWTLNGLANWTILGFLAGLIIPSITIAALELMKPLPKSRG